MDPDELPAEAREPLDRWRTQVQTAAIPASVREFAPVLHEELCRVAAAGSPDVDELARSWRSETGTDRRGRCLRILDRLGLLDGALLAVTEARDRLED